MTVRSFAVRSTGEIHANVTWNAVPELDFEVVMRRGGDLLEVNAKAKEGYRISARRLRLAPVGEMQRAIRARVDRTAGMLAGTYVKLGDEVQIWEGDRPAGTRRITKEDQVRHQLDVERYRAAAAAFEEVPRPGAAGRGEHHYAAIAKLYVSLLAEPNPTEVLAAQLGVSTKTASNLLFKAREKQLLTSLGRGRAGGELTDKARRLLDGNHQAQG